MQTDPTGAETWDATHYPWGQVWQQTGSHPTGGFYANLEWAINDPAIPSATREYNPGFYRWMTPDPGGRKVVKLNNPQTWNMYAYALDNPSTLNDPSGLYTWAKSCGQKDAACQKQRQAFRDALTNVRNARNSFKPKSEAYKRLSRVLAAYGTEGHGGPAIAFGNVAKAFGGNFNPATNTVTLDLGRYGSSSLGQLNLGT